MLFGVVIYLDPLGELSLETIEGTQVQIPGQELIPYGAKKSFDFSLWRRVGTAPDANDTKQDFTVTHPFHPWRGRQFELIDRRRRWGQWRVYDVKERGCQS